MTAPPAGALEASRESRMVVIERGADGVPTVWCDPEIVDLVKALNVAGIRTVASCSGHGEQHGNIALKDGRELLIAPDYDTARQMERALLAALRLREWIPVSERLPLELPQANSVYKTVNVLAFDGNCVHQMEFQAGATAGKPWREFTNYGEFEPQNITHWMPLPAPPTADDLARVLEEGE